MIRKYLRITMFAGVVFALGCVSAQADVVFNFNSLGVSSGDNSAAVATYMGGILGCVNCVTVTGAATDQKYNGDGHVVGPGTGSVSLTLGNTDGATNSNSNSSLNGSYDTFLANTAENSDGTAKTQVSNQITIKFTTPLSGVLSFDYEIFPDGTCPDLSGYDCGTWLHPTANLPDLDFMAKAGASTLVNTTFWGVAPGNAPIGSIHSPNSGSTHTELAPQLIGVYNSSVVLNGVTELDFVDWPATIGVDNIKFTNTVPEPRGSAFFLGGLILAAFLSTKLRRASAKS